MSASMKENEVEVVARQLRCLVCGGDHEPDPHLCTVDGMAREIERLGAIRWNRLTAHVSRATNSPARAAITALDRTRGE